MKKIIRLFICLLLLFILSIVKPVQAFENFITDYDVAYIVKEDGLTHTNMKVTLTNAGSDYTYASSYTVDLGFNHLSNISASDIGGVILPKVGKINSGYTIALDFNKKVVGSGNKQVFTLSFDTSDIAQKVGKIWEINIPGIDDAKSFDTFNVSLRVPKSFGKPTYIKPAKADSTLTFTKEELSASGISLAFGDNQQYSFTLLYHLKNKNLFPIRTEVAIPPNTNYQDVYIDSIEPEPTQVKKDTDGNWLAEYTLNKATEIDVKVKGRITLYLRPKKEPISDKELAKYLQDKPYWQSNSQIRDIAASLKTTDAIYDYVVKKLSYDFSRITNSSNRLGAIKVLEKPSSAVCLEFTDLFISIARAAGIPAREVDGYAYTENPRQRPLSLVADVLHAWPEYYDKKKQAWIMVDPTWGNTTGGVDYFHTLDFDHVTFVKKGLSSTYPIPAGGYKISGEEDRKDVFIWPTTDEFIKKNDISLLSYISDTHTAGFPITGRVIIVNKGPRVSTGEQLILITDGLSPKKQVLTTGELLPYAKKEIVFRIDNLSFLTNRPYRITMQAAGKEYTKTIHIVPLFLKEWKIIGGIFGSLFAFIILVFALKTRRLRISR